MGKDAYIAQSKSDMLDNDYHNMFDIIIIMREDEFMFYSNYTTVSGYLDV